jgi:hypothetical protein
LKLLDYGCFGNEENNVSGINVTTTGEGNENIQNTTVNSTIILILIIAGIAAAIGANWFGIYKIFLYKWKKA